jgi:hypothetical protein
MYIILKKMDWSQKAIGLEQNELNLPISPTIPSDIRRCKNSTLHSIWGKSKRVYWGNISTDFFYVHKPICINTQKVMESDCACCIAQNTDVGWVQ